MPRMRTLFYGWASLSSLALLLLSGCAVQPVSPSEAGEQRLYEQSIKDASVRGPGWDTPLWPLTEASLSVSTFQEDATLDTRTIYTWVAPTHEVWERCRGKPDSVLALQQLLGLPPQRNPKPGNRWRIFVFEIDSRDLFRPCPGGMDPTAPTLSPRCRLGSDLDPRLDPEFTEFLLQQWWSAHRATVEHGRDPELGYPWTAMGWTYDWDPASKTHVGVSEFVVKKNSVVRNVRVVSPADFCQAKAPP